MKTKDDIKDLNFQDYAFFKGVSLLDAKWVFASRLFTPENLETTKTGIPKITASDRLPVKDFDFTMRSNSLLDGQCQLQYLCDYYNRGVAVSKIMEYSENKSFVKAMKFTGKDSIVNEILNRDQLLKIQKTWLLKNSFYSIKEVAIKFEISHKWAAEYMTISGVDVDKYGDAKRKYLEK